MQCCKKQQCCNGQSPKGQSPNNDPLHVSHSNNTQDQREPNAPNKEKTAKPATKPATTTQPAADLEHMTTDMDTHTLRTPGLAIPLLVKWQIQ